MMTACPKCGELLPARSNVCHVCDFTYWIKTTFITEADMPHRSPGVLVKSIKYPVRLNRSQVLELAEHLRALCDKLKPDLIDR